jgi:hypothetical protein
MSKSNIKFTRFGGLSPLKQDHYVPDFYDKGFHNPPVKKGFYAMISGYESQFLLGATDHPSHISGKSQWLKDDNGKLIEWSDEKGEWSYDEDKWIYSKDIKRLLKKYNIKESQLRWTRKIEFECPNSSNCDDCVDKIKCEDKTRYLFFIKKPKVFTYTGELWHHLVDEVKQEDIIQKSGSWVKTTYSIFCEAFHKHKVNLANSSYRSFGDDYNNAVDFANRKIIDPYKNSFGFRYCKDELEVFIEKI